MRGLVRAGDYTRGETAIILEIVRKDNDKSLFFWNFSGYNGDWEKSQKPTLTTSA